MDKYTMISHINDVPLPTHVISQTFIYWVDANNMNGDFRLGIDQDPAEVGLIAATTYSGKDGYIKTNEANGILDCLVKYYEKGGHNVKRTKK